MKDENYLDMATALSGTGPAYVFLIYGSFGGCWGAYGVSAKRIAEQLVKETVRGSVDYFDSGRRRMRIWQVIRDQVTSPGRNHGRSFILFRKNGLSEQHLSRAVWAAYNRSIELGNASKKKD